MIRRFDLGCQIKVMVKFVEVNFPCPSRHWFMMKKCHSRWLLIFWIILDHLRVVTKSTPSYLRTRELVGSNALCGRMEFRKECMGSWVCNLIRNSGERFFLQRTTLDFLNPTEILARVLRVRCWVGHICVKFCSLWRAEASWLFFVLSMFYFW